MDKIQTILDFWFEGVNDATIIDRKRNPFKKWFARDDAFDSEIRRRFEKCFEDVLTRGWQDWEDSVRDALTLIVLCDQFARNMYRGTPRMYAGDVVACPRALKLIENGEDWGLDLIERVFVYMPLMHAEDLGVQKLSIQQFQQLVDESRVKCPMNTSYYLYSLDYARKHYAIVERFGRFPHRNAVLDRASSLEEIDLLERSGSGF